MTANCPVDELATLSGVRLRIGNHIAPRVADLIKKGEYEHGELRAVAACLSADDVVMEFGSGLGLLATYCAKTIGGDRVFTYEANPLLGEIIRANFLENGVSPQLSICALGANRGKTPFYVRDEFWASSLSPCGGYAKRLSVPLRDANAEIRRIRPTFLIVDIEGGEYDLFRHLDLGGVSTVVMELHPPERADADEQLLRQLWGAGLRPVESLCGYGTVVFRRNSQISKLDPILARLPWRFSSMLSERLRELVPPGDAFVLVDPENLLFDADFAGRERRFLVEHDGIEWGMPADDNEAIQALECRRVGGAGWILFVHLDSWFLEAYPGLLRHLRQQYVTISDEMAILGFRL